MTDFVPLEPLPQPRRVSELAPEALTYKGVKERFRFQESARVVDLAFCPSAPHKLAVVSGTKVGIWKKGQAPGAELELDGTVSKFKNLTQCTAWRSDGKLMLAGEAGGSCAVIEVDTRTVLRRLRGHGDAVTCCAFASADKSRAATGSKDGRLRIWDVPTMELLQTLDAHGDCLKALASGPGGPDSWITAGYDRQVRLWDVRAPAGSACVTSADHGHPVEDGAAYPHGALYVSAGGPEVKVWDLATGGRPVQVLAEAHSKAITGVSLSGDASMLLTASFDCLAKVWHAADLSHIWSYRLSGPATCAAWRPDGHAFAVGLDDGSWVFRARRSPEELEVAQKAAQASIRRPWLKQKGRLRGMDRPPEEGDEVIELERPRKRKEGQIDFLFRKFEYKKAVEFMVQPETSAPLGLSIVEELLQRGALAAALTEVGEDLCLAVLRWLLKSFGGGDSLQQHLFHEALHTLLDSNRCLRPPSNKQLVEALQRLEHRVVQEMRAQEALIETSGMLRMVLAA